MRLPLAMIALGALCGLVSGCGCSKEAPPVDDGTPSRMKDAAYTNRLNELHDAQVAVASEAAAIKAAIAALGSNPESRTEYADLTNRLSKCVDRAKTAKRQAFDTVRARILKESAENKANLKK